ncbi:MAG TPA: hypothetical protein VH475_03915 [Tepidisphaeraceae bacterium]|jgi:hypothetical protein
MDPLPITSITHSPNSSDDSSEEARRDERRRVDQSKTTSFRMAMERMNGTTPATAAGAASSNRTQLPSAGSNRATLPNNLAQTVVNKGPDRPVPPRQDQALSPSLLKVRAEIAAGGGSPRATVAGSPRTAPPSQTPVNKVVGATLTRGDQQSSADGGQQRSGGSMKKSPLRPGEQELLHGSSPAAENARIEARLGLRDSSGKKNDSNSSDNSPSGDDGSEPSAQFSPIFTALPLPAAAPTPQVSRVMPPTQLLNQVVEFATVAQNQQGFMEFHLGLAQSALGGLRIRVCSYGQRRVGLSVYTAQGGIGDAELSGLIEGLRGRNVEVVDLTYE